mmetsp:Transcript_122/g.332  ORF Transcript_122/g.332 Transcript_122/m.332 type:complete len:346 (+) Transcript_122:34-1071(+)
MLWLLLLAARAQALSFSPGVTCTGERVGVVGATGYIGRYVVKECLRRNYPTTAVLRDASKVAPKTKELIEGATLVEAPATEPAALTAALKDCEVVICCLASRSGTLSDSELVDYRASVNCLEAARQNGARHFVLLSAFCVAKPELAFQFSKLKTEAAIREQSDVTYSIVRPTAFFKSLSGQVEIVKSGGPFVYFDLGGDVSAKCNPIAETDLAQAVVDCVADPARNSKTGDPIWNIGGPDAFTMKDQGQLIGDVLETQPWLLPVPIAVFDAILGVFEKLASLFPDTFRDPAELARIGRYYAVENMLTTAPGEKYGDTSLQSHYLRVATQGQEYDPYTTILGSKDS